MSDPYPEARRRARHERAATGEDARREAVLLEHDMTEREARAAGLIE